MLRSFDRTYDQTPETRLELIASPCTVRHNTGRKNGHLGRSAWDPNWSAKNDHRDKSLQTNVTQKPGPCPPTHRLGLGGPSAPFEHLEFYVKMYHPSSDDIYLQINVEIRLHCPSQH